MLLPIKNILLKYNLSGFTLIELLLAITISGIVLTIGSIRYIDFNKTQTIKSAGQNIRNNLRSIQGKAMSGVKPTGVCGCLVGYNVSAGAGSTSYVSQASCKTAPTCVAPITLVGSTTFALPSGMYIHQQVNFDFLGLGKGASGAGSSGQGVILIKNKLTNPTKWYGICVTASGDVKDCGYFTGSATPSCSC